MTQFHHFLIDKLVEPLNVPHPFFIPSPQRALQIFQFEGKKDLDTYIEGLTQLLIQLREVGKGLKPLPLTSPI